MSKVSDFIVYYMAKTYDIEQQLEERYTEELSKARKYAIVQCNKGLLELCGKEK